MAPYEDLLAPAGQERAKPQQRSGSEAISFKVPKQDLVVYAVERLRQVAKYRGRNIAGVHATIQIQKKRKNCIICAHRPTEMG